MRTGWSDTSEQICLGGVMLCVDEVDDGVVTLVTCVQCCVGEGAVVVVVVEMGWLATYALVIVSICHSPRRPSAI